jgi:hypothetical protein
MLAEVREELSEIIARLVMELDSIKKQNHYQ